jgi:ABC transporter transmembrane region
MSEKKEALDEVSHTASVNSASATDPAESIDKKEDDFEQRLAGLPEKYKEEILKQYDVPTAKYTLLSVLRYATLSEKALMVLGGITATASGAAIPLMTIIFGNLTNVFGGFGSGGAPTSTPPLSVDEFNSQVSHNALLFVYLGIGIVAASYAGTFSWTLSGERVSRRIRGLMPLCLLLTTGNIYRPFFVKMSRISIDLAPVKSPTECPTTRSLFGRVFLIR